MNSPAKELLAKHPGATVSSSRKINRQTLHDEVTAGVRNMIIEGELAPGSRIPERELCEELGISRTPLREALKVLAAEGMVDLLPNRGARVTQITLDDLQDLFDLLGVLEGLSGELACRHMSDEEIAAVADLHAQMLVCHREGRRLEYFTLNQRIHESIMAGARNRTLQAAHAAISGRIRHARYLTNLSDARWQQAVDEHETILQALQRRDGERLFRELRQHLKNKAEVAKAAWIDAGSNLDRRAS
jgi:DNA-binding GntR family transcriptional regulator